MALAGETDRGARHAHEGGRGRPAPAGAGDRGQLSPDARHLSVVGQREAAEGRLSFLERTMKAAVSSPSGLELRDIPLPLPVGFSFEQAAVLPVALHTLHNALVTQGRLKAGESVLIQGASSGVGLMGLQIARMKGAKPVMGSATNDARRARLGEFGADLAIDTRDEKWPDQVLEATGGKGVKLTVDMVSGPQVNQIMKATAVLGRIVNVGRLGGVTAEFNFDLHAMKRIDYIGVTFRTRSLEEIREIVRLMKADLWDAVTAGKLRLPIDRTFPLDECVAAQARMRANQHFGKIALVM